MHDGFQICFNIIWANFEPWIPNIAKCRSQISKISVFKFSFIVCVQRWTILAFLQAMLIFIIYFLLTCNGAHLWSWWRMISPHSSFNIQTKLTKLCQMNPHDLGQPTIQRKECNAENKMHRIYNNIGQISIAATSQSCDF